MISRRSFLRVLLASAVAESVDVEKLLWTPKPIITVPALPPSLMGIPYHQSNASTGEWLGIVRSAMKEFALEMDDAIARDIYGADKIPFGERSLSQLARDYQKRGIR